MVFLLSLPLKQSQYNQKKYNDTGPLPMRTILVYLDFCNFCDIFYRTQLIGVQL
jgi:hypothetical protein